MNRFVILFCAVVALAKGEATQVYRQCANDKGQLPIAATISGCERSPCHLPQLHDLTISINFTTPNTVYSMKTMATMYLNLSNFVLPLHYSLGDNEVTCNFLTNAQCPTQPGQSLEYVLRTFVDPVFPVGMIVDFELRIVDEQNNPLMCLQIPTRIVSPLHVTANAP